MSHLIENINKTSAKKQVLIDAKENSEFTVGENVYVNKSALSSYASKGKNELCEIMAIDGDDLKVKCQNMYNDVYSIKRADICGRWILDIGANPFVEDYSSGVRPIAFTLESILFTLDIFGRKMQTRIATTCDFEINGVVIQETNWNPFVFLPDGSKKYYQRDFVWTTDDKRSLIESIYHGIDCGKVLVRKRSFEELNNIADTGEVNLCYNDLVDGKQRLDAIRSFVLGEYTDLNGNYFADLSYKAQHQFMQHQLISYAELPENTPDETVIAQFLKLNFAGVPQSKEHIEFVKSIHSSFK